MISGYINEVIPIYGAPVKGCKIPESAHQGTFFNVLRMEYPEYGAIAIHVKNEGKRTQQQVDKDKSQGMVTGCADIIIPGRISFVCEMKSQSKTAKVSQEQVDYLLSAHKLGAFVCVAKGYEAALFAFNEWKLLTCK